MSRRPPVPTRTDTLGPYTTRMRSREQARAQPSAAVGDLDAGGERSALQVRLRQDRRDAAGEGLVRERGDGDPGRRTDADAACLRLGNGGIDPDSAEAVDLGERLPGGERHPFPDAEHLDDAADGCADRHDIVDAAATLSCRDLAW